MNTLFWKLEVSNYQFTEVLDQPSNKGSWDKKI